jgi:hypothetical protein
MQSRSRMVVPSLAVLFGSLAAFACSGSSGSVFQAGAIDGGAGLPASDASFLGDAASLLEDANQPPCPPAPVTTFTPTWKPPIAFHSGACSATQMSGFFDACLAGTSTTAGCTAFVQSNATCAACLQSNESDSTYGPVIWHASRTYYTTNIAGCIADEQGDAGAASCGAAYQAIIQCKETACSACLTAQDPDFARYSACEGNAESECSSYVQTLETACGSSLKDASSPVAVCLPPSSDTSEQAYLALAPVFCGQ